jgi:DNA-directed RNA polymerase III subunit RPC1
MVSGTLAKKTLGDGSKTGLFYTLIREHGPAEAARYVLALTVVV